MCAHRVRNYSRQRFLLPLNMGEHFANNIYFMVIIIQTVDLVFEVEKNTQPNQTEGWKTKEPATIIPTKEVKHKKKT